MIPSERPLYRQIAESFIEKIESGQLVPGDRLPSERELSQQLNVSRMTVHQAMNAMFALGLLRRERGRGTFVAQPKLEERANILISFSKSMREKGIVPGARLLRLERMPATHRLSQALGVGLGQDIYYVNRLRLANQEPMTIEHSYFPGHLCPGLESHDLERESIYDILAAVYGLRLARASQSFEPAVAAEEEAALLQVPVGAPLMLVHRTAFDERNQAVEYAEDLYRGDRSRFVAEMIFPA